MKSIIALGPDNINTELLQHVDLKTKEVLFKLIHDIYNKGTFTDVINTITEKKRGKLMQ
jgi:hypothetical protein